MLTNTAYFYCSAISFPYTLLDEKFSNIGCVYIPNIYVCNIYICNLQYICIMLCICQHICNAIEVCTCMVASFRSTLNDLVQSLNFYKCAVLKLSCKTLNPGRMLMFSSQLFGHKQCVWSKDYFRNELRTMISSKSHLNPSSWWFAPCDTLPFGGRLDVMTHF